MVGRRRLRLLALVLLATALHVSGIARTILPAQDGLKFIRIARHFQNWHATDVIRWSDQHPLYPALIALAEPCIARFAGHGPDTWRVAAQAVAALASIALLIPLYGLACAMFDDRIAALAVLGFVVLPTPMEVGHDTLSDSLGLLATMAALRLGAAGLSSGSRRAFVGCGLAAGVGFLARPEVALVPAAVGLTILVDFARRGRWPELLALALRPAAFRFSAMAVVFLTLVGGYALVKGEVSEKLALRHGAGLVKRPVPVRKAPQWLPPGLDDPRWDFSPKEEATGRASKGATPRAAFGHLLSRWAAGPEGFVGLLAFWGAFRGRSIRRRIARAQAGADVGDGAGDPTSMRRTLLTVYLVLFGVVLVRHVVLLGYLSDRHLLPMLAVALPWGAAGLEDVARGIAGAFGWSSVRVRRSSAVLLALAVLSAVALPQWRPVHRSRWGHWAAGRWLREHSDPGDAVLDTRGWSAFVADRPSYDYWHVRQALTDAHLGYVVVGDDELSATSRRAATLRALLAYSSIPVAAFPDDQEGRGVGVRVYRYRRPESWEGLHP